MQNSTRIFIISEMKIADIIIGNPYLLLMMEHLEINLEVREKTIEQICIESNINTDLFLTIANLFNGFKPTPMPEYSPQNIQTIISYLKNSHQYYLQEKYPQIKQYIEEINKINNHAEILMLGKFFDKYFLEVSEHLDYEDEVVFPYVLDLNNLLTQIKSGNNLNTYSVTEYREHHDDIEEKLTDLKNLLIKYMPQKNDRQIRRKLLLCLFELEYDLNIHSQIEESILIPLVEKMEKLASKMK
jgi:regulator of cell morphogenesis and NO signaling